jgi:hypothetical protein
MPDGRRDMTLLLYFHVLKNAWKGIIPCYMSQLWLQLHTEEASSVLRAVS